jgi:hypothetical protein
MTPNEALELAITSGCLSSQGRKPGIIIERLPKAVREVLQKLTSDQALNTRTD